jgi:hypothetical protein
LVFAWAILVTLVLGSLAYVGRSLVGGRRQVRREEERRALLLEREMALQLLRDLQHDHLTGKIEDEDFLAQKEETEARAILTMRRLDALGHEEGGDPIEMAIRQERLRLQKGAR